ncbi:MAG TPA: glycosyltransferase family 9 protein [Verrucomicrobiae bacterium]|nr:glycosyltransferase family 9 protein [Verrucomicrobiae bacterium]
MKVLILKPSSLGDVIQALPVLRLLKKRYPAGAFYWWIESGLAPLLEGDPDLAGIIRFERRRWARPRNWAQLGRDVRWARAQNFDYVIDLQCLARSAIFSWLANGQLTIGLDEPREAARGFYDIAVRRASYHTHAVDWYLEVVKRLGIEVEWDFQWLPARPAVAEAIRRKWPVDANRWVLLQPGARWINKRWPAEFYGEVVRACDLSIGGIRFAVMGGPEDRELGAAIVQAAPGRCLDLTGQLSLPEMLEWIRVSELMVTNDTGPMHAAAALGKPVVALFGPTEPRRTGPYGQLQNVLQHPLPCQPCMKSRCAYERPFECLRALPPSLVLQRVQARLLSSR